jgi:hypothetical protein
MMESNFYSDEFEQLIREKTEQYKMYPSEKVWKGVHSSLHTKRKWFIAGMSLLITGTLFFAGKELISPSHPSLASRKTPPTPNTTTGNTRITDDNNSSADDNSTITFPGLKKLPVTTRIAGKRNESVNPDPDADSQGFKEITITISNPVIRQPDLSEYLSNAVHLPAEVPALPVIAGRSMNKADNNLTAEDKEGRYLSPEIENNLSLTNNSNTSSRSTSILFENRSTAYTNSNLVPSDHTRTQFESAGIHIDINNPRPSKNKLAITTSSPSVDAEPLEDPAGEAAKNSPVNLIPEAADEQRINWLQDYALYNLPVTAKRGRKYWQFYVSPTVNYRTLNGGDYSQPKPGSGQNPPPISSFHPGDAKNYVDHDPALGFGVGGSMLYRVTRNFTLKAGLQFNYSRYTIRAYLAKPQQATIILSSYYGYVRDSITALTNLQNFGGRNVERLSNDYYQLSAPVGFELRILGNERLQWLVGGTVQPTYLLNTNSYVLTTDYTNYIKAPSLYRRWNINTGLETFLTYKLNNGLRLQAGPEFRYQLLSTYNSQYLLKENLKGYGLKIGVTKAF